MVYIHMYMSRDIYSLRIHLFYSITLITIIVELYENCYELKAIKQL